MKDAENLSRPLNSPIFSVGCVIMASGLGKRFGGNKLMARFDGRPLILRTIHATEGLFQRRVVVTRHKDVEALCKKLGIEVVFHALPYRSDTVRLGLEAIGRHMEGCVFLTGDQPLLRRETVARLVDSWKTEPECIWRAAHGECMGSPVLFPQWAFSELMTLPEGKGGGAVMKRYPEQVRRMEVEDERELMDVDTRSELETLETSNQK